AHLCNHAKPRFLASASHALVQPMPAARLFISSVDRANLCASNAPLVAQAESALIAGENLLGGLLDISRLDAGAQEAHLEHFPLTQLVERLAAEFTVM